MLSVNLKRVARKVFERAGTDRVRMRCLTALQKDDVLDLVSLSINPRDYTDAGVFKRDYQCVNFLRKLSVDIPTIDRAGVARKNFFSSEQQCWDTNRRFERFQDGGTISPKEALALQYLDEARVWIKHVLGALPSTIDGRFGPGATAECRGRATTVPDKLRSMMYCTDSVRDLLPLAYRTLLLGPVGRQKVPGRARGNRFTTVPKDSLKDRGICIEPGLNVWFQLGAGNVIRERLRRKAGIDLNVAQPIHRQWAQQASHDGLKATIDLSNASDTVAKELVRWLLPPDWFHLLDCLRSPFTYLGDKAIKLEKFSSMGNGYTFELETLIFLSLCHASGCGVSGVDYRVFGDDIIVDTDKARSVLSVLRFCGFTPNPRKTFSDGYFRESCGGDYFKGVDVSSHFQKVDPAEPEEWIRLANGIRRTSLFRGVGFCYTPLHTAWLAVLEALPVHIRRLRGPEELGDLVIHDSDYPIDRSKGYGRVRVLKPCLAKLPLCHWDADTVMAYSVYDSRPSGLGSHERFTPKWPFSESPQRSQGVIPRGAPKGYRLGYVTYG